MPAVETVAKLNHIGGKTTPAKHNRFQPRMSGIFSPDKTRDQPAEEQQPRRASGKLQRRKSSRNESTNGRRNSLSLPGDNEGGDGDAEEREATASKAKQKPVLNKGKKNANNNQSPLKKHGYNLQLEDNPRVNLNDSPAKNTRSKSSNPLDTLAKANLPVPTSPMEQTKDPARQPPQPTSSASKASTRKRKASRALDDGAEDSDKSSNAKRLKQTDDSGKKDGEGGDEQGDEKENTEDSADDSIAAISKDDNPPTVAPQAGKGEQSTTKTKRGRPPKPEKTKSKASVEEQHESAQQKKARQEQLEEVTQEDRHKLAKHSKMFVRNIGAAIQSHGCADLWAAAGGAALMIQKEFAGEEAGSVRGKAVVNHMNLLRSYLKAENASPELKEQISKKTTKLEGLCRTLERTDRPTEDRKLAKDLFLYVIPSSIVVLRDFLRGSCSDGVVDGPTSEELIRLVNLAINICDRARGWEPAPSTLESGVRRLVRNDILASLKRIKAAFQPSLDHHALYEQDRLWREDLRRRQLAALEQRQRYIEQRKALYQTRRPTRHSPTPKMQEEGDVRVASVDNRVVDIDELDGSPGILPTREQDELPKESRVRATYIQGQRPQLDREPTADLPPPSSITLTEKEKVALLNGLQRYTGEDRYNDILNDKTLGSILGKRDLDDLMEAARSFSQMMASKMGIEVYRADSALWWLRSTDPDTRDRDSPEL